MPEVLRFGKCKICVYADEHGAPHFHIRGPGWEVKCDTKTFAIIAGEGPRTNVQEGLKLAAENQAELLRVWSEQNDRD
jgi:Domain of unknown function (DUF4160)